jgi:retron-type reverse transcriptase
MDGLWNAWHNFRRGKKFSYEIAAFEFRLLDNLFALHQDIVTRSYRHGSYRHIEIAEKKRRDLAVATIRDRVVHRLLYDYLVHVFDRRFMFDVWSCRKEKGLIGCITRTQELFRKHSDGFFWRSDVVKFFDHVRHDVLTQALERCIENSDARWLLHKVIASYQSEKSKEREREFIGHLAYRLAM